jgi:hypothetical protein
VVIAIILFMTKVSGAHLNRSGIVAFSLRGRGAGCPGASSCSWGVNPARNFGPDLEADFSHYWAVTSPVRSRKRCWPSPLRSCCAAPAERVLARRKALYTEAVE